MSVQVDCECGHRFEVHGTMAGGLANCPSCGKATPVPGLRDPLWRLWQAAAVILVAAVTWPVYATMGPGPAVVAAVAGLLLAWLASKLL